MKKLTQQRKLDVNFIKSVDHDESGQCQMTNVQLT
jgi:hypothetical protein